MNNNSTGRDIVCRTHSARSERDLYRVCPSKLNKRELEDLYFALLENNLELKRTINGQREKIKTLSAKVQRLSAAQKSSFGRESRECCLTTKVIVNEQKDTIAELKKSNERMSERIRLLNMRLCSAKQFVKRSPVQSTTRCVKCCSNPPANSPKNSTIALNTNLSESNMKTTAVSCHNLTEKEITSTRSVHTETDEELEKEDPEKPCDENKCRTLMEELKQKIVNLQEELSNAHTEYSSRIGRLEMEVSSLQARELDNQEIASRLTRAEVRNGDLAMELSIEKGKVAELETNVKAAQMSSKVAATIEGHLANIKEARRDSYPRHVSLCSPCCPAEWEEHSPRIHQSTPTKAMSVDDYKLENYEFKLAKTSDDSGYTETNKNEKITEDKALYKLNQDLMNRVVELQTQLDQLKVTATSDTVVNKKTPESPKTDEKVKENEPTSMYTKEKGCVIIEPEKETTPEPTVAKPLDIQDSRVKAQQTTTNVQPEVEPSSGYIPPKYPVLWVNDGQKNLEDTDEGSYTIQPRDKPPQVEHKAEIGESSKDDHNKFQIPGPIAVEPNKARRKSTIPSSKTFKSKESHKIKEEVTKTSKDSGDEDFAPKKLGYQVDDVKADDSKDVNDVDSSSVKFIDRKQKKDSVEIMKKRLTKQMSKIDRGKDMPAIEENVSKPDPNVQDHSLINYYIDPTKASRVANMEQICPVPDKKDAQPATSACPPLVSEPVTTISRNPRSCACVDAPRGMRSSVGFAPDSKTDALRRCQCKRAGCEEFGCASIGTQIDYTEVGLRPLYQKPLLPEHPQTYTIPSEGRGSRASDTDHEISAMTDLPVEREDKSPARPLSPGEDKLPSTYTQSTSSPTTDYGTLSEGELPTVGKARRLSVGERPAADVEPVSRRRSSQHNMEETLHAITEELARCKQLLLIQRRQERDRPKSVDADVTADLCPAPIALKRAPGNQVIGDTFTPKCIFTLHIGTVVLSDEAVVKSHDISLVLSWKFYDQTLAMTRMRAGRVVLFDFSTEYDVKITDDFLNYMKHEEMPIVICELDGQDEPFASCALPLRDALLHTNRRADMSLALVAGPQLREARGTTDALDGGDEVGVLDLWCMLRAEPRLLPAINRAIAKPAPVKLKSSSTHNIQSLRSGSRIMEQILEDDQSNDRLSQELDLNVGHRHRQTDVNPTPSPWDKCAERSARVAPRVGPPKAPDDDVQSVAPAYDYYDVNKYPVVRRRSSQNQHSSEQNDSLNTDFGPKNPDEFGLQPRRLTGIDSSQATRTWEQPLQNMPSGVIINEVPANIRSTDEMKQALERNAKMNNLLPMPRLSKAEEAVTQAHSSVGSLKSIVTQRHKMRFSSVSEKSDKRDHEADNTKKSKRRRSSRLSFCRYKKSLDEIPPAGTFIEEESEQEIAKKYDNISRIIETKTPHTRKSGHHLFSSGSGKLQDNSKKVKIDHKYCETPTKEPQPVQDVAAEESYHNQSINITILWLALNEECEAMMDPKVQRLYVAYSFLGRSGADLETPISLPKPKHYVEKCHFNFKKTFQLHDYDLPLLGHMAGCRSSRGTINAKDCIIFSVVSEPPEDPLGLDNCEDIGSCSFSRKIAQNDP